MNFKLKIWIKWFILEENQNDFLEKPSTYVGSYWPRECYKIGFTKLQDTENFLELKYSRNDDLDKVIRRKRLAPPTWMELRYVKVLISEMAHNFNLV